MFRYTRPLLQANKFGKYISPSQRAIQSHEKLKKEKARGNLFGKIVQYGFLSLVGGSLILYIWQPWNPYSKDISKELRKGLWDERDGEENYLEALRHYQNALNVAKQENMKQLSLEYTGIVLKIAEMYQNLNMTDKLVTTYYNLSNFIFENLIHGNISKDDPERELLIDRDLIVITRWAMLKQESKGGDWASDINNELRDRMMYIENKELLEIVPWLNEEAKQVSTSELIDFWAAKKKDFFLSSTKSKWVEKHMQTDAGKEFIKCWDGLRNLQGKAWPLWMESYIRLRDYYAMFQMKIGNWKMCIRILQSNLLWSCVGDFQDTVNEKTQIINLASAWFQLGQSSNDINAYNESKKIYQQLISCVGEKDSILPLSYYSLGVLFLQTNEKVKALDNFTKAKDLAIELDQIQILDKIDDELIKQTILK